VRGRKVEAIENGITTLILIEPPKLVQMECEVWG